MEFKGLCWPIGEYMYFALKVLERVYILYRLFVDGDHEPGQKKRGCYLREEKERKSPCRWVGKSHASENFYSTKLCGKAFKLARSLQCLYNFIALLSGLLIWMNMETNQDERGVAWCLIPLVLIDGDLRTTLPLVIYFCCLEMLGNEPPLRCIGV